MSVRNSAGTEWSFEPMCFHWASVRMSSLTSHREKFPFYKSPLHLVKVINLESVHYRVSMCDLCFLLPVIVLKITVLGLFKRSDIINMECLKTSV